MSVLIDTNSDTKNTTWGTTCSLAFQPVSNGKIRRTRTVDAVRDTDKKPSEDSRVGYPTVPELWA
jgi:hypothetical protein